MMSQRPEYSISVACEPSFQLVKRRVAAMLREYAMSGPDGKPGLSQREMAGLLGSSWEMVNKSLKALHEEGSIRIEQHRIIIKEES
jgi:hypothetical protein